MITQDQLFKLKPGSVLSMTCGPPITVVSNISGQLTLQFTVTRDTNDGIEVYVSAIGHEQPSNPDAEGNTQQ